MPPSPYRELLQTARHDAFGRHNRSSAALSAVMAYSERMDTVLKKIFADIIPDTAESSVSLVALGGYGRQELFPHSDIDILILHTFARAPDFIESMVRALWDSGLSIGCVVRTQQECGRILGQDMATDTAFLESRHVAGALSRFDSLQRKVVAPYFQRHGAGYAHRIHELLEKTLFEPSTTIYHTVPELKNGPCCLRDCQRLVWAEKAKRRIATLNQLPVLSILTPDLGHRFVTAYEYLSSLRTEVHLMSESRMDVLETALQPDVARKLGFGENGAGTLMEGFFRSVRDVRTVLLTYLEQERERRGPLNLLRQAVSVKRISPGISLRRGMIVPNGDVASEIGSPVWIIKAYETAIDRGAGMGVDLQNRIAVFARTCSADGFKSRETGAILSRMLSSTQKTGQSFALMHESGVLAKVIPQFEALTCKVEYDSYHEYTVDQHILMMLVAFDALGADEDESVRTAFQAVNRRTVMRLAILLHDIGKSMPGDHVHNSAVMADTVCERLGLGEEDTDRIRFLIYNHLELHNLSVMRDPEDGELQVLLGSAGDRENLDMLYILTVLDIRCVGSKTWTAWKAYMLSRIYSRLSALMALPGAENTHAGQHTDPSAAYQHDILPEDKELHRQLLSQIGPAGIALRLEDLTGFQRLTVCGSDRVGFLSDIIGCITSEGCNILSAQIFTTPDGKVLDVFSIEPPQHPRLTTDERSANLYRKWGAIGSGETDSDSLVAQRLRVYPPPPLRVAAGRSPVDIRTDNETSQRYTLVEVDTPDNFGLLHKIARCMSRLGVNIASARLSTRIDLAVDVFYVTDTDGRKITDDLALQKLVDDLKQTLGK